MALLFLESYKEANSSILMTFHYYSPKMLGPSAAPVVELNYVPIQKKSQIKYMYLLFRRKEQKTKDLSKNIFMCSLESLYLMQLYSFICKSILMRSLITFFHLSRSLKRLWVKIMSTSIIGVPRYILLGYIINMYI